MRIFISEYLGGGAWPDGAPPDSLAREGRAMLEAILADATRLPGVEVHTTWDARLERPFQTGATVHESVNPGHEAELFRKLARTCERTLLIAPELDGQLRSRCWLVEAMGGTLAGPSYAGVALTADKLLLAQHLDRHGIATLPTHPFDPECSLEELPFPLVLKPRDGAGSQDVRRVDQFEDLSYLFRRRGDIPQDLIWQPYVAGRALSVAVVLRDGHLQAWPVAEQHLSGDGRFRYLGGRVPAQVKRVDEVRLLAGRACNRVPGLRGYVGVDLLLPDDGPPLVVEINPRLTTSYLGYRRLSADNLAAWVLGLRKPDERPAWGQGPVDFTA